MTIRWLLGFVVGLAVAVVGVCAVDASAKATTAHLDDSACRGCHGDNSRQHTLPSGEEMELMVDLGRLDAGAHSSVAAGTVPCTGCHTNATRYRYPHASNPAQTRQEFADAVAEQCQDCHYPHSPFHDAAQADYRPPTCVDCHGSHTIDWVDEITRTMTTRCLDCHTDQTVEWVDSLIAPRPGLGVGAPGYAGSARCSGCHEEIYFTWSDTLHARVIQNPAENAEAIVGHFGQEDADLTFSQGDVVYTVGSRWKQQYLTQTVEGKLYLLPAQWNVATQEWVSYHAPGEQLQEWLPSCGSCHVTGLNTETWGFTEFGVGCESCHGPGDAHSADPENVKPFSEVDDQVCGACHSRGKSPAGYDFPSTYHPGDTLADHFTFADSEGALWPDGSARLNHQQYMDWQLGSPMALAENTNCVTCHAVHDVGAAPGQLTTPLNHLCLECHDEQRALIKHTPYHEHAIVFHQHEFTCADCHMPLMATSAVAFDLHNHSLMRPNPQKSIDHGGVGAMPNACNTCHTEHGEDPAWALQTISAVSAQTTPSSSAFFGPGPTPTPPPPPTPISSVGQPVERVPVETGKWLRNTAFTLMGLLMLAILVVIVRSIRARRMADAG